MSHLLPGKRVLIVEDNPIIAYDISGLVEDTGAEPVGPALDLEAGIRLVAENHLDAALLDIDLGGDYVWPIAEALDRNQVPYAFVSAQCSDQLMPESFRSRPCIYKPARPDEIVRALLGFAGKAAD